MWCYIIKHLDRWHLCWIFAKQTIGPLKRMLLCECDYRYTTSMIRHPNISLETSHSIWMSNSLTDGLAMVVHRIGHCDHWISVHYISMCGVTWKKKKKKKKTWCMNARWTYEMNYSSKVLMLYDTLMMLQFFFRLHFPQSSKSWCTSKLTVAILNI
jgi:hypothetical protein